MVLTWRLFYSLFFLYRSVMAIAAQVIIGRFTSLGDQSHYGVDLQIGGFDALDISTTGGGLESSRQIGFLLTKTLGGIFYLLFSGNMIGIGWAFQAVAFLGILAVLTRLESRVRIFVAIILLLPSFNVWSSIPSKEAIVVFGMGLFLTYVIDCYYSRERLRYYQILGFIIVVTIKPYYLPALLFLALAIKLGRRFKQPATSVLLGGVMSLLLFALVYDKFWEFAQKIQYHLHPKIGSLSRGDIWQQPLDVITEAPRAMFLSLFGPTFEEALIGPIQMFSFLESSVLLVALGVLILRGGSASPVHSFLILLFTLFWILFLTHPFGAFNPGAAVRYRAAYYILIVLVVALMPVRQTYIDWRRRQPVSNGVRVAKRGVLLQRKRAADNGRKPV